MVLLLPLSLHSGEHMKICRHKMLVNVALPVVSLALQSQTHIKAWLCKANQGCGLCVHPLTTIPAHYHRIALFSSTYRFFPSPETRDLTLGLTFHALVTVILNCLLK